MGSGQEPNDYNREYKASDIDGNIHTFQIKKHIAPVGIIWMADEIQNEEMKGYKFQVLAEFDEDQEWAIKRLHHKIRKELSKKYIETMHGDFHTIKDHIVRGRIEWRLGCGDKFPSLIVDGKAYT